MGRTGKILSTPTSWGSAEAGGGSTETEREEDREMCYRNYDSTITIECGDEGITITDAWDQWCECEPWIDPHTPPPDPQAELGDIDNNATDMGCRKPKPGAKPQQQYQIKKKKFKGGCPEEQGDPYPQTDGSDRDPVGTRVDCTGEDDDVTEYEISWEDIERSLMGVYHEEGGAEDQEHQHGSLDVAGCWLEDGERHCVMNDGMLGMAEKCGAQEGTDSDGATNYTVGAYEARCMAEKAMCCPEYNHPEPTSQEKESVMEYIHSKLGEHEVPEIQCVFDLTDFVGG